MPARQDPHSRINHNLDSNQAGLATAAEDRLQPNSHDGLAEHSSVDMAETSAVDIVLSNPYAAWTCAFGYNCEINSPPPVPSTKSDFIDFVYGEMVAADSISRGLGTYIRAIKLGEYHTFSQSFLDSQEAAADTTINQLYQICQDLGEIADDAGLLEGDDDRSVPAGLTEGLQFTQPWIWMARAGLISCHVHYKVNYVLGQRSPDTEPAQ